jgi:hypothetical protein
MKTETRWWLGLLMSVSFACGNSEGQPHYVGGDRAGYQVWVSIQGKPQAFSGTQIEVSGRIAPGATTAAKGNLRVDMMVCTANRQRFLTTAKLPIRVTKANGTVVESIVERVACRLSKDPGVTEYIYVNLGEDGRIDANFTFGTVVFTSCASPNRLGLCPRDDF